MKTESFKTLEVGRKYLTREGKVVTIKLDSTALRKYPYAGNNGYTYTASGKWQLGSSLNSDLISRIVEPTTLTIQRWGVLWRYGDKKGSLLIGTLLSPSLPRTFKTRKQARLFAKHGLIKVKPVKVKCTYEAIE